MAVDDSFKDNVKKVELRDEEALSPGDRLSEHFPVQPEDKLLHIIARSPISNTCEWWLHVMPFTSFDDPFIQVVTQKLRQEGDARQHEDVTGEILSQWIPDDDISLPKLEDLGQFLDRPLLERAKIPLDRERFEAFISDLEQLSDTIRRQDVEVLFRISDHECAEGPYRLFFEGLLCDPPNNDASKDAFHSFWNFNIHKIIEAFFFPSESIRAGNEGAAVRLPSYGFLYDFVCPFRGEVRSPTDSEDPRAALSHNMTWTYHPAPYVLGYYATGTIVTLTAICRPLPGSREPQIVDLFKIDLRPKANRIRNFVRLINVCSLIKPITNAIGQRTEPEFYSIWCNDIRTVKICGTNIKKTFNGPDGHESIRKLKYIYEILQAKAVPNVDQMTESYSDSYSAIAFLEPRGVTVMPKTIQQVIEVVGCILDALAVMHEEPRPVFHRDIRWQNVVQCGHDPRKWFLIDWDEAATPPTRAAKHLEKRNHAPAVFKNNHGAEVDLWAVGQLIVESSQRLPKKSFPSDLLRIREDMKAGKLAVSQSIQKILALKSVIKDDGERCVFLQL